MDYILYFFITFSGITFEPAPPPQIFHSEKSCNAARELIINDLKPKLNKELTIIGYCVKDEKIGRAHV